MAEKHDAHLLSDPGIAPETEPDLTEVHPADAAEHLETLPLEEQLAAVQDLPPEQAALSIAEMSTADQARLMTGLPPDDAAVILSDMFPDDAADLLDAVDESLKERLLSLMDREHAQDVTELMAYDPDTAGGVMTTDIFELDERLTVDQAIQFIRREAEDKEIPYYAYLVDDDEVLVGVLSMRDLLVSRPGKTLRDMVENQSIVSVRFDMDKEEVARLLGHYNFLALPVVDYADKLLGVVTVDDVIDIIHEEATEDMQKMVGAASDETTDSPWNYSVKKRLPWLVVNVLNSAVSAYVVALFEGTIEQRAFLAVLMPIVANQAGNTGQQALAVMVRQLATERFDRRRSWLAVLREAKIGVVNGVIIAALVLVAVGLITTNVQLAVIMSLALYLDMIIGALAGASIPLILKELGRDPAQSSSIFLTTLTDSLGFLLLLGLAWLFLFST
jgi:magnesium transporter